MNKTEKILPCPFCGGEPELVDSRVEWFVRCNHCKPFPTVIYGENVRHIDHLEDDEEAKKVIDSIYWGALKQTAITAWNKRATPPFLHQIQEPAPVQADARAAELLRFLQDQCIDLRCFTTSDGEDVGWRTVQHHMSEPRERVVSEVYGDQPRRAIREAMARIERDPYCTGPLHLEDAAAIAAAKGE